MSEPKKMSPVFEGEGGSPPKKKTRILPFLILGGFGMCVVLIAVAVGVVGPIFAQMRVDRSRNFCQSNLRTISRASLIYATDNDDRLPLADNWATGLERYVNRRMENVLRCPTFGRRSGSYGLAMNSEWTGKRVGVIENAGKEPLTFDSTDLKRGAVARPDTMPKPGRHQVRSTGNNVAFADGSVRFVPDAK